MNSTAAHLLVRFRGEQSDTIIQIFISALDRHGDFDWCLASKAAASDLRTRILRSDNEFSVFLPEAMNRTLHDYDPAFGIWKEGDFYPSVVRDYRFSEQQAPSAVIGDFNADGILDIVLDGHNKNSDLRICILSNGKSFGVVEISRSSLTDPKKEIIRGPFSGDVLGSSLSYYLEFEPWGGKNTRGKDRFQVDEKGVLKPFELKGDAFRWMSVHGRAAYLYVYDVGKFEKYWAGKNAWRLLQSGK